MKMTHCFLVAGMVFVSIGMAAGAPKAKPHLPEWDGKTAVYAREGWRLEVTYLNPGTRSEGQHGRLWHDGEEVRESETDRRLDTPLGELKYYGAERRRAWDLTGWNFADRARVPTAAEMTGSADGEAQARAIQLSRDPVAFGVNGGKKTVSLEAAGEFRVLLEGNPTTGYNWYLDSPKESAVHRVLAGPEFEAVGDRIGAGGVVAYTIETKKRGTTELVFAYRRAWETNRPVATARVYLTVE